MEREKSGLGYSILVGFLCLVLGLLGGYILTDKVLTKECDNTEIKEKTNKNEDTTINAKVDLSKLEKYKYNDNYGSIKTFNDQFFSQLIVSLSSEGKVKITDTDGSSQYITNLENIVDFVEFVDPYIDTIYFLSAEGNVYSYQLSSFKEKNFTAKKENMSNIVRIMQYTYATEKSYDYLLIGITQNGETVILNEQ